MTCFYIKKPRPERQIPCHSSFSDGIICGLHRGSFGVRDHLRSNLGIISRLGITCGRGSFAALYSTHDGDGDGRAELVRQCQIVQSVMQDCQCVLSHLLPVFILLVQGSKITYNYYLSRRF